MTEQYGVMVAMLDAMHFDLDRERLVDNPSWDDVREAISFFMGRYLRASKGRIRETLNPGLPLDDIDWGLIVACLMRFYPGSTPEQWMRTPSYWIQACLDYSNPLEASDNLTAVTVGALAAGRVAARNADPIRLAWERAARRLRGTEPEGPPNDRLVLMDSATGRGKITLMKAVTAAIGDYGSKAHRSVIAMDDKRNAGQANPAMFAPTSPARVCYIEEVGNVTSDLDKAKNIASGGTEKVRGMRENWKDAEITATLWMLRNPPPPGARQTLGLHDSAMVRRLKLITVPPLPASSEVDLFANGFTAATSEGRRRRQALVAKLVKLATSSQKPVMPDDLATAMHDARQAEVGVGGGWLRSALEHVRGERVSTAAIWSAYCSAMGQPDADGRTKVEGFTRDGMLAEIRRIYTPGPVKHLWIEGKTQRGLDGWTLADQSLQTTADEFDAGLVAC